MTIKLPTIPELTDTRNTAMLGLAATNVSQETLQRLRHSDRNVIAKATKGKLEKDDEIKLVFALVRADLESLRALRDQLVRIICENRWLTNVNHIGFDLLVDEPAPKGKGSLSQYRTQLRTLREALVAARKIVIRADKRRSERAVAAEADPPSEADGDVATEAHVADVTDTDDDADLPVEPEAPVATDHDEKEPGVEPGSDDETATETAEDETVADEAADNVPASEEVMEFATMVATS